MSTLTDRLNARRAQMGATPVPSTPAAPPAEPPPAAPPAATPPTAAPVMSAAERIRAQKAQRDALAAASPPPAAPSTPAPPVTAPTLASGAQPINPPGEYQPPMSAEEREASEAPARDESGEKVTTKRPRRTKAQMEEERATKAANKQAPLPLTTAEELDAIEEEELKEMAADKEARGIPAGLNAPIPSAYEPPAPRWATPAEAKACEKEGTPNGFALYIDCLPLGQEVVQGEVLFEAARAHILETYGMADFRYFEFGKGPGYFQATLRDMVKNGLLEGKSVFISSATHEGALAITPLGPLARFCVRGMR